MDWPTTIIGGLVIGAMVAVVARMYLRKRSGQSACASGCSGCASAKSCGAYQPPSDPDQK